MKSDINGSTSNIEESADRETVPVQEQYTLQQALQELNSLKVQQAGLAKQNEELRRTNTNLENILQQNHIPRPILKVSEINFQYQLFPDGCACFPSIDDSAIELFGVTPEQVREDASPVFAHIHPEDYYGVVMSLHESAAALQPWDHDFRVTLSGREERQIKACAYPQKQADGSILWQGAFKDTSCHTVHGATHDESCPKCLETNAVLTALLESMSDWIWEVDSEGRYVSCSPHVEKILGYTPAEMLGKTPFDFMPPDEAAKARVAFKETCSSKDSIKGMVNGNFSKDGHPVILKTYGIPLLDKAGNLKGYRGIDVDITEKRLAADRLRNLSRAVQQSPVSIVITNTNGMIEFVNPKFTELTGYTPEEVLGQNPRILNAGQTSPEIFVELWKTICAGGTWKGEVLNKAKDGSYFWEISTISPLFDDNGNITHYLAVKEDITEKKQISDQLVIARDKAEAATEAKSSFLATMSHEIRTPMNGVIGMTSLLLDTDLNKEQREYTEVVRRSAENLLSIINELLDFSKIESGKLDLEILDFDLRPTIEDTAELLSFRVADKELEFICSIDPDVPSHLKGDPGRLRQIIINLVGNAIKFTDQGEIVINVSLVSDSDGTAVVRFEISDSGIGIPPDKLDAVFAPFTQAEASTSRNFGGTGLGLTICKQLAELMGGEIGVTSEIGKGSTFWFTARFEKQPVSAAKNISTALHADISGTKVLVVTTSVTNRALATTLLNQWGCNCVTAADGESALSLLQRAVEGKEPFRLLLTDQKMPGMDGRELGRRIKSDPLLEPTLMVMLTSAGQRGDAAALKQLGFAGYLAKPIRPRLLHDAIALVLGKSLDTQSSDSPQKRTEIITRHTVAEYSGDRVRILLAEDNPINQKVALGMLNKIGYKTDAVNNGREALRALELIDYDLVLMDCMMPEMDGYAATAAIRDTTTPVKNHAVPIIAMTANAMKKDQDACLAAGMDDFLAKPVRMELLSEMIEKWLQPENTKESSMDEVIDQPDVPQLFDEEELLANFDDDREFAESILREALQELPGELKTLEDLAGEGDTQAIMHQAHTLKGLSANICTPALREVCFRIEDEAHRGNLESVRALLSELNRIAVITTTAVREKYPL